MLRVGFARATARPRIGRFATSLAKTLGCGVAAAMLAGCVTLTEKPRALLYDAAGVKLQSMRCDAAAASNAAPNQIAVGTGLDPERVRLLTWNVHKEDDAGWEQDLQRFVADHDVVLLQEVTLIPTLRAIVESANLRWVMAVSFQYKDTDIGVLTAARSAPVASCTERIAEPLIVIPKSSVITWFALNGRSERLAIVNVHAINFALTLGAYEAQMAALADALVKHQGPIIFAGDLNTWTAIRVAAVDDVARRLGLSEITFSEDKRTLFFGKQLDHIYVRGLEVVSSAAIPVTSSDHNPVSAILRVRP